MTFSLLTKLVCEKTNLSQKDAEKAVNKMFQTIMVSLINGNPVKLKGFGNFEVRIRLEREYRNPATGITIKKEKETIPIFKSGKYLRQAVNNGYFQSLQRSVHRDNSGRG